jgi:hypothetical protein
MNQCAENEDTKKAMDGMKRVGTDIMYCSEALYII